MAATISDNVQATIDALDAFPKKGDNEATYQAPICAILGNDNNLCRLSSTNASTCTTNSNRIGCAGFRREALKIILHAFSENQCYYRVEGNKERCLQIKENVGSVLASERIHYIGLYNNHSSNSNDDQISTKAVAEDIGRQSGSVNTSGEPFVYEAVDADLPNKVQTGITDLLSQTTVRVFPHVEDIDVDASKLIASISINTSGQSINGNDSCYVPTTEIVQETGQAGQLYEGIERLLPGNTLCYDIKPVKYQEVFQPQETVQIKKARIKLLGDGIVINSGIVYFVIPPKIE